MLLSLRWKQAIPYYAVYNNVDGDDDDNKGGDGAGDGGTGSDGTDAGDGNGNSNSDDKSPKFSQAHVNKMLAEHKRNLQKQVDIQIKELEGLRRSKNLSEKEKSDLTKRIEDLQASVTSKEELAQKEKERMTGEHKRQVETLTTERDFYKVLFTTSTIENEILTQASDANAYHETQIVELLKPKSRLVEILDQDGNPIPGKYVTKVKLEDKDKEGKPTTLDLSVAEALKRMKERTDEFGNLFKTGVAGGLGDGKNRSSGKEPSPKDMPPAEYREWRKKRGF